MGQIRVFIPAKGGKRRGTVAIPDKKAALWGETVNWHIHCSEDAVEKVMIEFANKAPVFQNRPKGKQHFLVKDLPKAGNSKNGKQPRTCSIYAHVPELAPPKGDQVRRDKYTLVGLTKDNKEVPGTKLDPEIITTDPGSG